MISVFDLSISLKDFFAGSKVLTLNPNLLIALKHALPLSKLTSLSFEDPPKTTNIFFFLNY